MLYYIIQIVAFQVFFLIVYDLFLQKETFFNVNRAYLLGTAILSLILPVIKISSLRDIISQEYVVNLPEVFIGSSQVLSGNAVELNQMLVNQNSIWSWELFLYFGTGLALMLFIIKLSKILRLLYKSPKQKKGNLFIVSLLNSSAAFSFLNCIFLGTELKKEERESVLKHEMIHVEQKHTLDLLFFELMRILFWFNPLVYMYQNRMMSLHEFIADDQAVKTQSKNQYYQNLLSQVFETKNISFINPFFKKSLIKKRIIMLQKSKSKQIKLFKYALLIPMVFGMLVYTSCIEAKNNKETSYNIEKEVEKETPLIEKIKAIKKQIEIQGNLNDNEEKGLKLLSAIVKGENFDPDLVKEVTNYTSQKTDSELVKKICIVFEQIQVQGHINDDEEKELKKLLVLTSDDGFDDPFFADIIKYIDIPFGVIDQVPLFPGCEDMPADKQKKCMAMNVSKHVNTNFNVKLANELKLTGRQRINVIFKINTEGDIVDVRSRAPHPELEKEAIRVIKTLPKFTPGEHKGKKVNVPYSLPIIFAIEENKSKE
ncbi:blaR1 peptidase M56 family protein [Algibacter marinivivus]|uniref:BlaR1 peptidase M56 family protein n=1 Tax=Algibacter marinivivus TaxID=2100723 RepID=A0A2U2X6Y0_9FLAO|nr:M56 family metallopeptidase [Algibacter marinivivus]PWH83555.1 blaR1 peptidase M56 family protein [Algibacter marinivivus]